MTCRQLETEWIGSVSYDRSKIRKKVNRISECMAYERESWKRNVRLGWVSGVGVADMRMLSLVCMRDKRGWTKIIIS